jgi:hypothetical protein
MFGHDWDKGEATIVARNKVNRSTSGDGLTNDFEFVADVHPAKGEVFRATIQSPMIATNFWPPDVRDKVFVLIDAKHGKVKFDKDDPRIDYKARKAARHANFEQTANDAPGTDVPPDRTRGPGVLPAGMFSGDPAETNAAVEALRAAALQAMASGKVTSFGSTGIVAGTGDTTTRLALLDALKQKGLMTDEEYATARQRIINAI